MDRRLSDHVLALHTRATRGVKLGRDNLLFNEASVSYVCDDNEVMGEGETKQLPLEQRLQVCNAPGELIQPYLLRKYIAYAREYVNPKYVSQ